MIRKAIILLFPLERQHRWTYWKTAFPSKIKNSLILILWISFDSRAICGDKKRLAPLLCFRAFSSNALHHYNYYQHHVIMFPWRKVECFMNSLYSSPSILPLLTLFHFHCHLFYFPNNYVLSWRPWVVISSFSLCLPFLYLSLTVFFTRNYKQDLVFNMAIKRRNYNLKIYLVFRAKVRKPFFVFDLP